MPLLSKRHQQICELVATGFANKQIASELGIAKGTLDTHMSKIFRRCGVHSRTELAVKFVTSRTANA